MPLPVSDQVRAGPTRTRSLRKLRPRRMLPSNLCSRQVEASAWDEVEAERLIEMLPASGFLPPLQTFECGDITFIAGWSGCLQAFGSPPPPLETHSASGRSCLVKQ